MSQAYTSALQTMVDEIHKTTPEITGSFIFTDNGKILAKDEFTTEQSAKKLITAFNDIDRKSQTIGGLETLTIFGNHNQIYVSGVKDLYLATICTRKADKKTIELLTKVLVPSVVKLADQLACNFTPEPATPIMPEPIISPTEPSAPLSAPIASPTEPVATTIEPIAAPTVPLTIPTETDGNENSENPNIESEETPATNTDAVDPKDNIDANEQPISNTETVNSEPTLFKADEDASAVLDIRLGPLDQSRSRESQFENVEENVKGAQELPTENQLIVEKLGGLRPRSDTIRIDKELIANWKAIYPNKKIEKISIQSSSKKSASCKFEPIKDAHYHGKGLIQIPEKIQRSINVARGGLVLIKPVISED